MPTTDWTELAHILQMPEMVEPLLDNQGIDGPETEGARGLEDIVGWHYPDHERLPPDRYSPDDWQTGPSKRGRRN